MLDTLHKATVQSLNSEPVQTAFKKQMIKAVPERRSTPRRRNKAETAYWRKVTDEVKVELPDELIYGGTGDSTAMKMEPAPAVPAYGVVIEKDVDVPMRDGARLKADVFRPDDAGKLPAILNLGPYQKDKLWVPPDTWRKSPTADELGDRQSAMVVLQRLRRGAGRWARQRQVARPVRALVARRSDRLLRRDRMGGGAALVQRQGRAVRHLLFRHQPVVCRQSAAAVAEGDHSREGFADLYRDALFHGGLLSLFMPNWFVAHLMHHVVGRASRHHPNAWQSNTLHFWLSNSLDSGAFRGAQAQWDKITCRCSVGNWSGMALHLRGNTEAFMRAASKHKKLRIQAGTHVHPFYTEEGGAISCASSTTGSRASTTASWTSRR